MTIVTRPQWDGPDPTGNVIVSVDYGDGHLVEATVAHRLRRMLTWWDRIVARLARRDAPIIRVHMVLSRHGADLLLGRLGHTIAEIDADSQQEG